MTIRGMLRLGASVKIGLIAVAWTDKSGVAAEGDMYPGALKLPICSPSGVY